MTLLGKELRELAPFAAAVVVLNVVAIAEFFLVSSPDEFRMTELSFLLDQSLAEVTAVWTMALGVFAAYMTFPREHDERTIEFLTSLPVSPRRVFLTKYVAASGTLVVLSSLAWIPILFAMSRFDSNSITSGQFRWDLVWTEAAMDALLVLIAVAYGMLIAYFRMFGVLGAIVLGVGVASAAAENEALAHLAPWSLYVVEFDGTSVVLPWARWAGHATAAALALVVAARLWARAGERHARLVDRLARSAWYRTATTALAVSVVVATAAGILIASRAPPELVRPGEDDPEIAVRHAGPLTFRYLAEHEPDVAMLAAEAEDRYARVRAALGAEQPAAVVVDLTRPGVEHLGLASWKRVRMDVLSIAADPGLARHVLDHELAHVVASALSEGRLAGQRDGAQVFSEGLADWVAYELGARTSARAAQRRLARLAWARLGLEVDDLFDAVRLRTRFDEYLVYPLGESWVSALAQTCGGDAPGRTLRAMARPEAPRRLGGAEFVRDALQAIDCDLDAVNARFEAQMTTPPVEWEGVPEVTTSVTRLAGRAVRFGVRLVGAPAASSHRVWLRARDGPRTPAWQVRTRRIVIAGDEPGTIVLGLDFARGERFEYQLGVELAPGERPLYSRWIGASVADVAL